MPVPSTLSDLSTTAASNSPAGSDSIGTSLDDYLRSIQAIIKQGVAKGSDITAASTITCSADAHYFVVTGNTTISGITDSWNGRVVVLKFSGTPQLTHGAGFVLPGSANITAAAGDVGAWVNESTGVWRCVFYQKADGTAVAATTAPFTDSTAIVKGSSDATKLLRFEVDGFTTGTTRVLTPPNADATIAGLEVDQSWSGSQRGTITTDNDLSFDMNAANNFTCTPTAGGALTFTNITAGQSGYIMLVNNSNYAISAAATTKVGSSFLTTVSATGTYLISYYSNGTNVYCTTSGALS